MVIDVASVDLLGIGVDDVAVLLLDLEHVHPPSSVRPYTLINNRESLNLLE